MDEIIYYRLLPEDLPINPDKKWKGRVVKRYPGWVIVEILESGYIGMKDVVLLEQIVKEEVIQEET